MAAPELVGSQHAPGPTRPTSECEWRPGERLTSPKVLGRHVGLDLYGLLMEGLTQFRLADSDALHGGGLRPAVGGPAERALARRRAAVERDLEARASRRDAARWQVEPEALQR